MLLEGKSAIISGVGPNLGRAVALQFARHGASLVLGARTIGTVEAIAHEAAAFGVDVEVVSLDISSPESCAAAVDRCSERFGRVDILVNNAYSEGERKAFVESDLGDWASTMEVNLWGSLRMTQAVMPAMIAQKSGRIVMANSVMAHKMYEGYGAYSVSKAALATATKMLALELGRFGVRVNGLYASAILGEAAQANFDSIAREAGLPAEKVIGRMVAETSLKFLPDADAVAGTVLFLCSDLSSPVTGQLIPVDSGTRL